MKVRFSDEAQADLLRIGDYIAEDSPLRARDFVRRLRGCAKQIADSPNAFPLLPGRRHIRRRVFGEYLIFYWVKTDIVYIMRILHGAQDYEKMLLKEKP